MRGSEPQVFAPAAWLRSFNIFAALVLASVVVVPLGQALPVAASGPIALIVGAASLWFGLRAARSCVVLTQEAVIYRGVLRDCPIPIADLVDYRYDTGAWSWFVTVPVIHWKDRDGRPRRTRLWCFGMRSPLDFGAGSVRAASVRLRLALQSAVREAHRTG